jgi:hypothetical protein
MFIGSQAGYATTLLGGLARKERSYDFSLYRRHASRVALVLHTAETWSRVDSQIIGETATMDYRKRCSEVAARSHAAEGVRQETKQVSNPNRLTDATHSKLQDGEHGAGGFHGIRPINRGAMCDEIAGAETMTSHLHRPVAVISIPDVTTSMPVRSASGAAIVSFASSQPPRI